MQPLKELPAAAIRQLRGVLTDIDDTLTTHGRVSSAVMAALEALRAQGLQVIPITGRPAGWCDMIARTWPVDAVVGENGALYFRYLDTARKMRAGFADPPSVRAANRRRLDVLAEQILRDVPGTALASDQPYRIADLAIDFCEDVPPLPASAIDRIVALFAAAGATAKVSSIHVNGWFGTYDKLSMTRRLLGEEFGVDLDADRDRYLFIGDSPNDSPMFGFFPVSVGVANVCAAADRCPALPTYITDASCGAGFVELAAHLLRARSG